MPRVPGIISRQRVLVRAGHRCVVCSSTVKLEVGHRRALMNGGDNSLSNLATLCDDCHTIKTRMDSRLNSR
ncbi:MAG: HNH endonuclease [Lentisphaerae bacterium]|nr:HNH endonuclease [Lentisphaerota bacterium]